MSSNNLDFYIQGTIESGTPFHIVSKKRVGISDPLFDSSSPPNVNDRYWSTLGVQENYVNIYDVITKPFYYYDSNTSKYYYPLYLSDRGGGALNAITRATGTVSGSTITITSEGQGFTDGQSVEISDSGTANANVTVNQTNGVASVYNITNSTLTDGTVLIRGTVTNPLFDTSDPVNLIEIEGFDTNTPSNIFGFIDTGLPDDAIINVTKIFTYPLMTGTGLPVYNSTTKIMNGGTEPPHPDLNLKSWDAIKNNPYVVYQDKFYYPLYLYNKNISNVVGKNFTRIENTTFYHDNSLTTASTGSNTDPNQLKSRCMFYNPFDSLMDSLFKYKQNEDGSVEFELVSAGHYMESSHKHQYMSYTESGTPTNYTLSVSSNITDSKPFVLEPVGYNLNTSRIYAGVPYILKINENTTSLNYNFVGSIRKESDYLDKYFKDNYINTPSSLNFFGNASPPDFENPTSVAQNFTSSDIELYFIPAKETTYQISTHKILTHLDYNAIDMLMMSPQVYNVKPKILTDTNNTNYYNWKTSVGESTLSNELAFASQLSGAFIGLTYNYCTGNNTCGKCFGKCDLSKVSNPTTQCVYDSLSVEKFNDGEDTFTCDHERYYSKSNHVSNTLIENHSNTMIIVALVIGIIIAVGFILYEERNRIIKEFYKLKKNERK